MTKFEMINRKGIVVSLKKWSERLWYFEVVRDEVEKDSVWMKSTVLYRTFPLYNLDLIYKFVKGQEYQDFMKKRAEKLWLKWSK